jgi:hypothetical protein
MSMFAFVSMIGGIFGEAFATMMLLHAELSLWALHIQQCCLHPAGMNLTNGWESSHVSVSTIQMMQPAWSSKRQLRICTACALVAGGITFSWHQHKGYVRAAGDVHAGHMGKLGWSGTYLWQHYVVCMVETPAADTRDIQRTARW